MKILFALLLVAQPSHIVTSTLRVDGTSALYGSTTVYAGLTGSTLRAYSTSLTGSDLSVTASHQLAHTISHSVVWSNAQVAACGAVKTCNLKLAALPAGEIIQNMYVRIATSETALSDLTVSVGRTAAAYVDYIAAGDAQAAANTAYGDVVGERGSNLTGYDMPSGFSGSTDIYVQFKTTDGANDLDAVTGTTGVILVVTTALAGY